MSFSTVEVYEECALNKRKLVLENPSTVMCTNTALKLFISLRSQSHTLMVISSVGPY